MIVIGNGKVITRDNETPFLENGAVVVDGSLIVEIGSYPQMKEKYKDAQFIDAGGKVIMPGFINTHHHIYSAFARGLSIPGNNPQNFLEILEGTWWKIDRHLTVENTYYSALATYLECIKNGVTSVVDHHASYGEIPGSLFAIAKAAKELGIRTCLAYEISDRDGKAKMKEAVKESMDFIQAAGNKKSDMIKALVGLHASFTLSDETLSYIQEQNVTGTGYHIHIAEGKYDAEHCQKQYGKSVVKRLRDFGILGSKSIAGHCIHINEEDMNILKETDTIVVHNPESNMGNAVGCPDVITMLDKGILVGLGTDGYTSDMLESLKTANILQKHNRQKPDRGFVEAAGMLFQNNSKIINHYMEKKTGILKEGNLADIIIVDYVPYTPMHAGNIDGHIMFGMSGSMTDTTMINGKILMHNRKLLQADEEKIKAECCKSSGDLWKRL